jgi:hypothetical protein
MFRAFQVSGVPRRLDARPSGSDAAIDTDVVDGTDVTAETEVTMRNRERIATCPTAPGARANSGWIGPVGYPDCR